MYKLVLELCLIKWIMIFINYSSYKGKVNKNIYDMLEVKGEWKKINKFVFDNNLYLY